MGYPIVNVELQSGSFYAAFEEAVTVYGNEIYQYKVRENYLSMEGNITGSAGNFNSSLVSPTLGGIVRLAKQYGTEAGSGGTVTYKTGSVTVQQGVQDYDLNAWASGSGIVSPIEIKRVFFEAPPAFVRYFDPYAGTGTGIQSLLETFGFGQFSPGINFLLMPIFFDVMKVQAIEFNDQIRKKVLIYGTIAAVVCRIIFAGATAFLLKIHGIKTFGALLLLWVVYKLYVDIIKSKENNNENKVELDETKKNKFSAAVITILVADISLS